MAAGPYDVGGADDAGTGTEAAVDFLDRLRAVAAVHPVLALPVRRRRRRRARRRVALPSVLVRSLPGTPSATEAGRRIRARTTPATPSHARTQDGTAAADDGVDRHRRRRPDPRPTRSASSRAPTSPGRPAASPAPRPWPRCGPTGSDRVVLGTDGLTGGARAAGLDGRTANARAQVDDARRAARRRSSPTPRSGAVAGGAEEAPGGPRLAEQRYLAELALITLQAPARQRPDRAGRAAPRRRRRARGRRRDDGRHRRAALAAPGHVAGPARASRPPTRGAVAEPRDAVLLDPAGLADVTAAVATRDDLAGAVAGDAGAALQAYDAAISRATSVAWRGDPEGFRAAARDLRSTMDGLRQRVSLLSPADGTYSLASSDAPLVLTVRNDLPVRRRRAARRPGARQPRAVDRRHRPADARPGSADHAPGADRGPAVRRLRRRPRR